MHFGRWVEFRTTLGVPVSAGDVTVTPRARALIVRLPPALTRGRAAGAFVWNRPDGLRVERAGRVETIPIVDVMRLAWLLLALAAGAALLWPRPRRRPNEGAATATGAVRAAGTGRRHRMHRI
jgi:hypothetical protein